MKLSSLFEQESSKRPTEKASTTYLQKTAILVDGGFYQKRALRAFGSLPPKESAEELFTYCLKHLVSKQGESLLYRIFYYDCLPSTKKVYHPLLKKTVDLGKTPEYDWYMRFFEELSKKRKVALRLGHLAENQAHYQIKLDVLKQLCRGDRSFDSLLEDDFKLNISQKGVDMKIGLDISSLAFKRQVDQIVLISGDSDFISAAKHARREGIDFVLDNLGAPITKELHLHIDGLTIKDDRFKTYSK